MSPILKLVHFGHSKPGSARHAKSFKQVLMSSCVANSVKKTPIRGCNFTKKIDFPLNFTLTDAFRASDRLRVLCSFGLNRRGLQRNLHSSRPPGD